MLEMLENPQSFYREVDAKVVNTFSIVRSVVQKIGGVGLFLGLDWDTTLVNWQILYRLYLSEV